MSAKKLEENEPREHEKLNRKGFFLIAAGIVVAGCLLSDLITWLIRSALGA